MAFLSMAAAAVLFARLPARGVLAGAGLAAWVWARREAVDVVREAWGKWRALPRGSWWQIGYAGLVLVYGVFGLIGCLAPETGWDAGVYHFATARLRSEEGWMVVRPDIPFSYKPACMETLYTVGFLFDGERLASLVNFSFYFAGLALAGLWAGRVAGDRARLLAGLAYITFTLYVLRMNGGDVEVGHAVFVTVVLYALWRRREGGGGSWVVLAGLGLGMALGVKYSACWFFVAFAVTWFVLRLMDRVPLWRIVAEGAILGGGSVAIASPWYLRNFLATGYAFFPYQVEMNVYVDEKSGTVFGMLWNFLGCFRYDAFVLASVPALFVASARRLRWVAAAAAITLILLLLHMGLAPVSVVNTVRYWSPFYLGFAVLGALAVEASFRRPFWVRAVALGFLLASGAPAVVGHVVRNVPKAAAAVGVRSRDDFLAERVNTYWAIRRAARQLPPGKKVLLVEQRSYYCDAPFIVAADIQTDVRFDGFSTAEELREFLDRRSVGFIVADTSPVAKTWNFKGMLRKRPGILEEARVRLVEERGDSALYRIE